jgi:hypothetical protein
MGPPRLQILLFVCFNVVRAIKYQVWSNLIAKFNKNVGDLILKMYTCYVVFDGKEFIFNLRHAFPFWIIFYMRGRGRIKLN